MNRSAITAYMADRYRFRPGPATIAAMASDLGMTPRAVYARLWRAGVLRKDVHAMYHTDEALVAAYERLGSIAAVVQELGVQFYTVKDVLARRGRKPSTRPRALKIPLETVKAAIVELRAHDLEWQDIAKRLGIAPGTLWDYRKRMEAAACL